MALNLVLNGHSRRFDSLSDTTTLEQIIVQLLLKGDRVAIEHNGTIAPRSAWGKTVVSEGDRIEVVHFVGGGTSSPHNKKKKPLLFAGKRT